MRLVSSDDFLDLVGDNENLFISSVIANNVKVDICKIIPYWFMTSITERLEKRGFDKQNCCATHTNLENNPVTVMIFNDTWENIQNIYFKTVKLKAFL